MNQWLFDRWRDHFIIIWSLIRVQIKWNKKHIYVINFFEFYINTFLNWLIRDASFNFINNHFFQFQFFVFKFGLLRISNFVQHMQSNMQSKHSSYSKNIENIHSKAFPTASRCVYSIEKEMAIHLRCKHTHTRAPIV